MIGTVYLLDGGIARSYLKLHAYLPHISELSENTLDDLFLQVTIKIRTIVR